MSDVKFTPAPWLIGNEDNSSVEVCIGEVIVCIEREGLYYSEMKITREEMRANAHLIAAAPDMYEALSDALKAIESLPEDSLGYVFDTPDRQGWIIRDEVAHKVGRAMAKARGES